MWGKKNGCRSKGLCPVSFGFAIGITAFLAILVWSAWMMIHGVPEEMAAMHPHMVLTWGATFAYALLALVKGFIFGFVVALFYDCFVCCCKAGCCRKDGMGEKCGCGCGCGCSCCGTGTKSTEESTSERFRSK